MILSRVDLTNLFENGFFLLSERCFNTSVIMKWEKPHWGFFLKVSPKPIQFEILMRKVYIVFSRFRAMFVHFIPCVSLVILNFLLFRAMKEAENKREKLLNSNPKVNFNRRETKESKKIRDANTTTLMLIVVISVSRILYWTPHSSEIRGFC